MEAIEAAGLEEEVGGVVGGAVLGSSAVIAGGASDGLPAAADVAGAAVAHWEIYPEITESGVVGDGVFIGEDGKGMWNCRGEKKGRRENA